MRQYYDPLNNNAGVITDGPPASQLPADWLQSILVDGLQKFVTDQGITLDADNNEQIEEAIRKLVNSIVPDIQLDPSDIEDIVDKVAASVGFTTASNGGVVPEWDKSGTDRKLQSRDGDGPIILVPDALRQSVEAQSGGRMTVIYDDDGNPNYMHVLPRFSYADLGYETELGSGTCSAFVVGGTEKSEILIGAYQASQVGSLGCSLPGAVPWTNIDWDDSVTACTSKGVGWHLMTMHEWAAVALWCAANGFEPRGNTDSGRAHDASWERGIDANQSDETLAGSGPATWRHNGDHTGIADLVGNVWEWNWGMKLQDARVLAAPDNDWTLAESSWQDTGVDLPNYNSDTWNNTSTSGTELTDRLLITHVGIDLQGSIWTNTSGERLPRRGGGRHIGGDAGLSALALNYGRGYRYAAVGFRPAFVT